MGTERFNDHVVWITGASSGIGRELARVLAEQGADVAVSARRVDRLDEAVREIEARGRRALAVACDVTKEEQIESAVAKIVEHFGRLDGAIANAGFGVVGRIEELSGEDWRRQLDTNVVGAALTARYALPELRKTGGRIGLVGSVMGMMAGPKNGAYCASKYALRAIGQTLAMECHGTGVSCTTLHPGFVESEIGQVDNQGHHDPARKDKRPAKLMWPTSKAARVMVDALYRRRRELTFTAHGKIGAYLGRHWPGLVHFAVTRGSKQPKQLEA